MATWNHRVIRAEADGDVYYAIHECYYDQPEDTIPTSWTENPVCVGGSSIDELKWVLDKMTLALSRPALRFDGTKIVEVGR